jgi:hypothetical protein
MNKRQRQESSRSGRASSRNFGSFLGRSGEWRQLGWAWPDGEMVDSLIVARIDAKSGSQLGSNSPSTRHSFELMRIGSCGVRIRVE